MGHTECFAKSYQLDYCVLLHLHVTQHSVAWHHHVLLELGFRLLRLYHRCSCVAVLLLLLPLILTSLTQVAAGWKTSSHVRCVLDDPGACCCSDGEGDHVFWWCCSVLASSEAKLESNTCAIAISRLFVNQSGQRWHKSA